LNKRGQGGEIQDDYNRKKQGVGIKEQKHSRKKLEPAMLNLKPWGKGVGIPIGGGGRQKCQGGKKRGPTQVKGYPCNTIHPHVVHQGKLSNKPPPEGAKGERGPWNDVSRVKAARVSKGDPPKSHATRRKRNTRSHGNHPSFPFMTRAHRKNVAGPS